MTLKQIDLTCQVIAPAVTGWMLSLLPARFGILWVGLCNCLALLVELVSMKVIARMLPTIDEAKELRVAEEENITHSQSWKTQITETQQQHLVRVAELVEKVCKYIVHIVWHLLV